MTPRILVIRGGAIGDFILTLPAIKLLRENFPDAHIEILGYKHIVALAEGRYYARATRSIEYAALAGFFVPNSELAPDLIEYFASFQQVISYLYDPDKFFETNLRRCGVKYFLHGSPKLDDSMHAAQQLARPLQSLALYLENAAAKLHPSAEDREFAAQFLNGISTPVLALHPGSGSPKKNWPLQHWLALGEWLLDCQLPIADCQLESTCDTKHSDELQSVSGNLESATPTLLLIGGEADRENLAALKTAWRDLPVRIAQDLPLYHLAAVVEKCALFIGHDSGISHLAAAVGTQCVLLFGATDPEVWAPGNANVKIVRAPEGALEKLTPQVVKQSVVETLSSQSFSRQS